ncbi:2-succinyl-6-hydroxy-2,4-cyclohexadiene-1-carboxylate synthase [Vibrio sp. Of7-15]|uniref:2-succinyl-6-hydroxy-2, 4-cyclohexadiene-1-carboxylate synthase n=1 Tax=Vibrio sp. Of7-15 TaxID=2724879 RepID=UPI001EF23EA1|nr:2-succinyl-6-hydroxy-2,4-cyclohexadiene-1-carboxylate synthase [Vibrio sp. Of7-15]MCG7495834.1 2-succinyl-6-hydroxy-2,4-cyclohexadiene-1-carboxylate synthase [Vibrio sp. Of7-15]
MPLYFETYGLPSKSGSESVVVFLHGLLGSSKDWAPVLSQLSRHHYCLALDLPGHGGSKYVKTDSAEHTLQLILDTLKARGIHNVIFVGYSLGARLAMQLVVKAEEEHQPCIKGVVLEGGHFGLDSEPEKEARWANDCLWAARFEGERIEQVLSDWYQQAVFSSLNHAQRQILITKRSANLGAYVASMLKATSLAKQAFLLPLLRVSRSPIFYVCGSNDKKFQDLVKRSELSYHVVEKAGHNVHVEQPEVFSQLLTQFIKQLD